MTQSDSFLSEKVRSLIYLDTSPSASHSSNYQISKPVPIISKAHENFCLEDIYQFCRNSHIYLQESPSGIELNGFLWLLYPKEWYDLIHIHPFKQIDIRELLLWMTMDIERSLGNILFSMKIKIPNLLKDILQDARLREFIGDVNAEILTSLMGSPDTLNIRNILWHGFVSFDELHHAYVSATILVVQSIGHEILKKNLNLLQRPFSLNLDRCLKFPLRLFEHFELDTSDEDCILIVNRILYLYSLKKYDLALLNLLPYLESILRRHFTRVNNCPERLLTAESDQFYTTFEEIFSSEISHSGDTAELNRMRDYLGDPLLEFYYDILILPDGPRLRDRLSHGEFQIFSKSDSEAYRISLILLLKSIFEPHVFHTYRSIFHPFALLFQKVSEATGEILRKGRVNVEHSLPEYIINYSCLFRPKHEYELVRLLNQIADALKSSAILMNENVSLTTLKMENKTLRSRQRSTAQNMFSLIDSLKISQMKTLSYILLVFGNRNLPDINLKNIKSILSIHLNIKTWVKVSENKWDRVESALRELEELMSSV
ncbi:endoplasmic reticulum membrane-associated RNA degradation protein-like [Lepeophtheirus salmonis]|uniref:endoplasmic reticulum membrane-associated RNA degradation protein-like n=1 Tax=Lepeophtheirus salmonis TaxID=72036 RepID=UPI001AE5FBF5|nr:endoplasmic reticulum membrane-associated RNA degradation protein-like [Lepeophtheirus salmonis]